MPTPSELSSATPSFHPDIHRGTAFEQASAPGLTLSERYQKLMESVYNPDLSVNEQQAGGATLTNAQRKIQILERFKNTPQYQSFKNVINHTLAELDDIANTAGTAHQKNSNFESLANGLWEPITVNGTSRFGVFQLDLYQQACPDANRLVRMHAFAQQRPKLVANEAEANARACIKDLSERLDVCGPGLVQHFDEAAKTVRQASFTPSLPERFEALRIQASRNAVAEFVRENAPAWNLGVGNEIHKVAAWQNHFSQTMNLPVIDDVFASPNYTEDPVEQMNLKYKLTNLQPKPVTSRFMAHQILEEARDVWNQLQVEGVTDLAQGCMTIVDKISNKHGPVEPHTLFEMNEDAVPCRLHDNPTLLALSLMQQVKGKVPVFPNSPKIVRWAFRHQQGEGTLTLKSQLHLSWLETAPPPGTVREPERQLLSSKHLSAEQIGQLLDLLTMFQIHDVPFKSAVHELLRNDWGHHLEPIRLQEFDPHLPNDVFIHVAMGFAQGLKLGEIETHPKLLDVFSTALFNLRSSKVLKHYSHDQIVQLFTHTHQLASSNGQPDALDVHRTVNRIARLEPANVDMSLYKAALEFKWNRAPQESLDDAIGNPVFKSQNAAYGVAYVDVMAKCTPHCINVTLLENIDTMVRPEVALRFIETGATFNATNDGQPSALQRLLKNPSDAFVTIVLNDLSQRGVSLQEVAHPGVIDMLTRRSMPMAAAILRRYPGL